MKRHIANTNAAFLLPGLDHSFLSTRVSFIFLPFISDDEYSSVKFMELISFKTTNSLQSISTVAWRPIRHQFPVKFIYISKRWNTHLVTTTYQNSFLQALLANTSVRELCAAKIISLMPHTIFQHSQQETEALLYLFDWTDERVIHDIFQWEKESAERLFCQAISKEISWEHFDT